MTAPSGRTGRPPLSETRKAEIRLEIARAAVELFVAQGVVATTGEQIGQAVGVSARTVWRYFPSKEACVRPLFSAGIDVIAARLREWRPGNRCPNSSTPPSRRASSPPPAPTARPAPPWSASPAPNRACARSGSRPTTRRNRRSPAPWPTGRVCRRMIYGP